LVGQAEALRVQISVFSQISLNDTVVAVEGTTIQVVGADVSNQVDLLSGLNVLGTGPLEVGVFVLLDTGVVVVPVALVVDAEEGNVSSSIDTDDLCGVDVTETVSINVSDGDEDSGGSDHLTGDGSGDGQRCSQEWVAVGHSVQSWREEDGTGRADDVVTQDEETVTLDDDVGSLVDSGGSNSQAGGRNGGGSQTRYGQDELGSNVDDGVSKDAAGFFKGKFFTRVVGVTRAGGRA